MYEVKRKAEQCHIPTMTCLVFKTRSTCQPMFRPRLRSPCLSSVYPAFSRTRKYTTRKPPNPESINYPILNRLYEEYLEYNSGFGRSVFKSKAFNSAISALNDLPYPIQRMEDVDKVPGIGAGIKRRIEEFLVQEEERGNIPSTSGNIEDKKEIMQAMRMFQTIPGIGPKKAKKLATLGFRTLEDVMADEPAFKKLSKPVRTSMKYHNRTLDRVQRQDIERLCSLMRDTLPSFDIQIVGSYRRGAPSSSDVDVLLFHDEFQTLAPLEKSAKKAKDTAGGTSPLLSEAILLLTKAGLLVESLTEKSTRWQGFARVSRDNEHVCRLDLNLIPSTCHGAALIAFTGDSAFNQYLRAKARKVGMRLNESGLWKRPAGWYVEQTLAEDDDKDWELVPIRTEQSVFEELGEDWVDPEKRNFNNILGKKQG